MARKRSVPAGLTEDALDALVAGVRTPEQMEDVFRDVKEDLVERVLRAELTQHLGYADGAERPPGVRNARNGTTPKKRESTFEDIVLNIMPLLENGITPRRQTILSVLEQVAEHAGHDQRTDSCSRSRSSSKFGLVTRTARPVISEVAPLFCTGKPA